MRLLFLSLLFSLIAFAAHADVSAYRDPRIDYRYYVKRLSKDFNSAIGEARIYTGRDLPDATAWTQRNLTEAFLLIRNKNYLPSPNKPKFARRIPWLYPNDGCYVRVELANSLIRQNKLPSPNTVFAIGNLSMKTPYSPSGTVTWWFHVAPVVALKNNYYVLDPAVDASKPLPLKTWLQRIGRPNTIKVAICGPGTSSPGANCNRPKPSKPSATTYLNREWNQLIKLGKKPETLLMQPW